MPAQTTLIAMPDQEGRICPKCQTRNELAALERRQYRCAGCGLELAHIDMAANGAVRGVFGWVLDLGAVVHGRYQVTAVLGRGGFGVTYLVDDIRLAGKRRAIKEIPVLLFDEYETRLLGHLNHPAIPDIIDRFEADGMVYLVLEFGGSRTLRIEMDRRGGRIPVFLLLPWIEQVCTALVYLHSQDPPVIHRDLKPENILLDENERVMLIDFGIAKETTGDNVTRTIGRAFTNGFSPPEQVLGTGTEVRSDVYALGAILYCAITGRVPPTPHERITGTVLEPPTRFFPEIPPLLDSAICQALELNLHKRQRTIAELAQCLTLVRSGGDSARTIVATDSTAMAAGLRATAEGHLVGVEFPSLRQSQRTAPEPPVEPAPQPRPGIWAWVTIGLAGAILAGGAGWLYRYAPDQGPAGGAPANLVTPISAKAPSVKTVSDTAPAAAREPTRMLAPPAAAPAAPEHPVPVGQVQVQAPSTSEIPVTAPPPQETKPTPDLPTASRNEQPRGPGAVEAPPPDSLMRIFEERRAQNEREAASAASPPASRAKGHGEPKQQPRKQAPRPATREPGTASRSEPKQQPRKQADTAQRKPEPPRHAQSGPGASRYTPEQLRALKRFNDMLNH